MAYLDLARVFNGDLYLPWNGVDWRVAEPSAAEGIRLREFIVGADYSSDDEVAEIMKLLGHTPELAEYDRAEDTWLGLVEAGIGWASLMHFGRTALIHFSGMPEAAESHWAIYQVAKLVADTGNPFAKAEASA